MYRDFIEHYENAIPEQLCEDLIAAFERHPGKQAGATGAGVDVHKKNSLDLMLDHHSDLNVLKQTLLRHTFAHITRYFKKYHMALIGAVSVNVPSESGELICLTPDNFDSLGAPRLNEIVGYLFRSGGINLQKYACGSGGYPHWHSEHFPQLGGVDALHRVAFYMYYLNDVQSGGETEFYYQSRKISPKRGSMVIAPAGFTHTHRGNVPISQDKYIATSWILFNPAEKLYT